MRVQVADVFTFDGEDAVGKALERLNDRLSSTWSFGCLVAHLCPCRAVGVMVGFFPVVGGVGSKQFIDCAVRTPRYTRYKLHTIEIPKNKTILERCGLRVAACGCAVAQAHMLLVAGGWWQNRGSDGQWDDSPLLPGTVE